MVLHKVHGDGMCGGEGREGSLCLCVHHWLVAVPPVPKVVCPVVVILFATV